MRKRSPGRPAAGLIADPRCLPVRGPRRCDQELVGRNSEHRHSGGLGCLVRRRVKVLDLGLIGLGADRGAGTALDSDDPVDRAARLSPSEVEGLGFQKERSR